MSIEETWNRHFQYESLNSHAGEIRLLTILPRSVCGDVPDADQQRIICFLDKAYINQAPPYTSLSYTWGSPENPSFIEVNGTSFTVTQNLANLVRHLQQDTEQVTVWADAICIKQWDYEEKSIQIQHMLQIYRNARSTLIWLGGAQDGSDMVMQTLQQLAKDPEAQKLAEQPFEDTLQQQLKTSHQVGANVARRLAKMYILRQKSLQPDQELDALYAFQEAFVTLLNRDYWTRVWCLQELIVSGNAWVGCGAHMISVEEFTTAAKACGRQILTMYMDRAVKLSSSRKTFMGEPLLERSKAHTMLQQRRNYLSTRVSKDESCIQFTLASLLFNLFIDDTASMLHALQSRNPSDRVYGLLGLADDSGMLGITPQYSKSWQQVYKETMYALLKAGHWQMLLLCQDTPSRSAGAAGLPLWVPDWQQSLRRPPSRPFDLDRPFTAGGEANTAWFELDDPNILSVKGTIVSEVVEVGTVAVIAGLMSPVSMVKGCLKLILEIQDFWRKATHSRDLRLIWKTGSVAEAAIARIAVGDIEPQAGNNGGFGCKRAGESAIQQFRRSIKVYSAAAAGERIVGTSREGHLTLGARMLKPLNIAPEQAADAYFAATAMITGKMNNIEDWITYAVCLQKNHGRRPFLCRDGRIGVGPGDTAIGDKVVVLSGCGVPFILRPAQSGYECYQLLGEAYVHGIMDGEFVQEPRPYQMFNLV